jgi:hypothetical protein
LSLPRPRLLSPCLASQSSSRRPSRAVAAHPIPPAICARSLFCTVPNCISSHSLYSSTLPFSVLRAYH